MAATYRANITAIFLCAFCVPLASSAAAGTRQSVREGRNFSPSPSVAITALGTPVTQNFDTLASAGVAVAWTDNTTLPGWYSQFELNASDPTTYTPGTGSSTAGAIYSFGVMGTHPVSDRALGSISSNSIGAIYNALKLTNNTGASIVSLAIAYTGEQWRNGGNTNAQTLSFQYQVTTPGVITDANTPSTGWTSFSPLDFVSPRTGAAPAILDGNAPANRTPKSANLAVTVGAGQEVWLRWVDSNDVGADHALAIDDLSVTANGMVAIHTIQGSGTTSPLVGQSVTTSGIVTALRSNGFFLQTPDANADADPNTSEGIFVFTSTLPPAATIGNALNVTGTVAEFSPVSDSASPPVTELTNSTSSVLSTGNPLPAPVSITSADTLVNDVSNLEKFEGMRVSVSSLTVVEPTGGFITESTATSATTGAFYGVITGVARPFVEPGIPIIDSVPPPPPANVPRFDTNPERLRVDSDAQPGSVALEVTTGAVLSNLVGVLDYTSRTYTILPDASAPPTVTDNTLTAIPVPTPSVTQLTLANFNIERFFDATDDPAIAEPVLTAAAFNNRLKKASLAIRNVLQTPDVIGVEEVENLAALQALAGRINSDAVAAAQPNPNYQAFLAEGNDPAGIDVGFLVKSARVSAIDVTQVGLTTTYINPNNGQPELLNDRPPLVLRATVPDAANQPFRFTVIVNHLRSLGGINDPVDGNRVRTKRRAQAEYLANLVQSRQATDPTERLFVLGDFNSTQFNDGYVDPIGTIKGTPTPADQVVLASSDLVNPNLTDLIETISSAQRYSYSFGGNAEVLDHIMVTGDVLFRIDQVAYARLDADFPESFRNDSNRPERISDHDAAVAYVSLAVSPIPTQVVSRKMHGAGGPFDINMPLSVPAGIECRSGGATGDHQLVVTFPTNVSVNGNPQAQVTNGTGQVGSGGIANGGAVTVAGAVVTVPLTNVGNAQTLGVTLFGVNDGTNIGDVVIPMGVLLGDVNGSGGVNATDVSQTKLRSGQPVDASNFRSDVVVNNSINGSDVSAIKLSSGTALP